MEHWTTAQRCCSSWKWLEEGNWGEPKVQAICSAKESQSAGFAEGPHSEYSRPESACSDGSSFDGPHLRSCTSTESERKRRKAGKLEQARLCQGPRNKYKTKILKAWDINQSQPWGKQNQALCNYQCPC